LFFLQALNHSLAKVALFLTSGNIIQMTGTKNLSDIRGVWTVAPLWGTILALSAVAITGVPPFGAFIPEWIILLATASSQLWIQFSLILFSLTLTFIAVTFHTGRVLLGTPRKGIACVQPVSSSLIPAGLVILSLVLGLTITPALLELQK
jgi:hydrogenase-4 component F